MSRERRFLVDPSDLGEGTATIRGVELHHLARVLRLAAGDDVSVFDGRGRGFRGLLESVGPAQAVVRLRAAEDPGVEPSLRVDLYQAIPHGDRMDWIVEKATEVGAARIVPIVGERGVVRPRAGRSGRAVRWRRIAESAAKQSGRLVVPGVEDPLPFEEALAAPGAGPAGPAGARWILQPGAPALAGRVPPGPGGTVALLVGPEGGWSTAEVGAAAAAGWLPSGLGARILRADTAGIAALSLLLLRD